MQLTFLVENSTIIDCYYIGEPALCIHIDDDGETILFDTGYSDVFIGNAAKMGIPLEEVGSIVLSHGHNDHTGGLPHFFRAFASTPTVYAHPQCFRRIVQSRGDIGAPMSREEVAARTKLILSRKPVQISTHCFFLGEIPCYHSFERRKQIGSSVENGELHPDFCPDDTAVAYVGKEGLTVITGCSHSGICNIIEHAKALFPACPVRNVVGGLHLRESNIQLSNTVAYLQENSIAGLYPCHCTAFAACAAIHGAIPLAQQVGVGVQLEFI